MNYLYHLTYKENLNKIMAEGLEPQIGPNSQRCIEEEPFVYLCDKHSVPYWAKILQADTVIKIPLCVFDKKKITEFDYSCYKEITYPDRIPAEKLKKDKITKLTPNQEKELALSYIDSLSSLCMDYAECYLEPKNFEDETALKEQLKTITNNAKMTIDIVRNLDYASIDREEIREALRESCDMGAFTLCDECDYDEKFGKTARMYQKLLAYPNDEFADTRKELNKVIKTALKYCLRTNTGGFRT